MNAPVLNSQTLQARARLPAKRARLIFSARSSPHLSWRYCSPHTVYQSGAHRHRDGRKDGNIVATLRRCFGSPLFGAAGRVRQIYADHGDGERYGGAARRSYFTTY